MHKQKINITTLVVGQNNKRVFAFYGFVGVS